MLIHTSSVNESVVNYFLWLRIEGGAILSI